MTSLLGIVSMRGRAPFAILGEHQSSRYLNPCHQSSLCPTRDKTDCEDIKMPRSVPCMDPSPKGAKQGQNQHQHAVPKRKRSEVVDLTGDNAEARPSPKTPRTGQERSFTRTPSQTQRSGPSTSRNRQFARTPSWTDPSPSSQSRRTSYAPAYSSSQQHSQSERNSWLENENENDNDNDIFENVASTQDSPVSHEAFQKYGELPTKIVGVRYYQGSFRDPLSVRVIV